MNSNQDLLVGSTSTLVSVGAGASSYMGWFNYLNTYAPGIGVLCSIIFGLFGIYFMFKASRKQEKAEVNEKRIEHIEQELSSVTTDITDVKTNVFLILDKLNDR